MRVMGHIGKIGVRRVDFLALFVGLFVMLSWGQYSAYLEKLRPASDWFTINKITIPNFEEGQDPAVLYDRTIRLPFYGDGRSEVRDIGGKIVNVVCSGTWERAYEPNDILDPAKTTFSWMLGKSVTPDPCQPPPGQYVAWFSVRVKPLNGEAREVTYTTDPFIVYPKGGQLFITPEQVKKLEEPAQ